MARARGVRGEPRRLSSVNYHQVSQEHTHKVWSTAQRPAQHIPVPSSTESPKQRALHHALLVSLWE